MRCRDSWQGIRFSPSGKGAGMFQLLVNGEAQRDENGCKTWGELLVALDRRSGDRGQVVTAVRFDGVDQPAFRGTLESSDLADVATVEVEAVAPRDLLLSTIDQAVHAVDTLQQAAERIGAS